MFLICFVTVFATLGGFYSKLTLSYGGLLAHGCYSISFIGGFYIYIVLDYLLTMDSGKNKNGTLILLVSSLPLLGLFIMGIYSVVLVLKIDEEYEARKNSEVQPDQQVNRLP